MEILFELNAALDHLSRHYTYKESEAEAVAKAYAHMKRACLDVFKITLRETLPPSTGPGRKPNSSPSKP